MEPETILDEGSRHEFAEYDMRREGILWEGRPEASLLLYKNDWLDLLKEKNPRNLRVVFWFYWILFTVLLLFQGLWKGAAILLLAGLAGLVAPAVYQRQRRKNTLYAVSKSKILFQLWRWGQTKRYIIDWADVERITYEELEERQGTLHFITGKDHGFSTYDLESGERRFHLTFELIPEVVKVWQQLEQLRQERRRTIAVSPVPVTK